MTSSARSPHATSQQRIIQSALLLLAAALAALPAGCKLPPHYPAAKSTVVAVVDKVYTLKELKELNGGALYRAALDDGITNEDITSGRLFRFVCGVEQDAVWTSQALTPPGVKVATGQVVVLTTDRLRDLPDWPAFHRMQDTAVDAGLKGLIPAKSELSKQLADRYVRVGANYLIKCQP